MANGQHDHMFMYDIHSWKLRQRELGRFDNNFIIYSLSIQLHAKHNDST